MGRTNRARSIAPRTVVRGKRKAEPLWEGEDLEGTRLDVPLMSDFFLPQMGDVFTEDVHFDTSGTSEEVDRRGALRCLRMR